MLKNMKKLHMVTFGLLVIGGLNWGLEAFGTGIGHWISSWPVVMLIYILVGLSALVEAFSHKGYCKNCETKAPMQTM